jgi:hypothetical protein
MSAAQLQQQTQAQQTQQTQQSQQSPLIANGVPQQGVSGAPSYPTPQMTQQQMQPGQMQQMSAQQQQQAFMMQQQRMQQMQQHQAQQQAQQVSPEMQAQLAQSQQILLSRPAFAATVQANQQLGAMLQNQMRQGGSVNPMMYQQYMGGQQQISGQVQTHAREAVAARQQAVQKAEEVEEGGLEGLELFSGELKEDARVVDAPTNSGEQRPKLAIATIEPYDEGMFYWGVNQAQRISIHCLILIMRVPSRRQKRCFLPQSFPALVEVNGE